MYMVIGADIVPTKSNIELFIKGDVKGLVGEKLEKILTEASYRIFNLEVPLTDHENPILKQGPNLIAPADTVAGYRALGIDLLTLANNHIMDQGEHGIETTNEVLDNAGISHVGVGKNLAEASTPYIFSFAGKKVGVYACAEHEYSIATEDTPGANPLDLLWSLDHVEELKRKTDFVIVLYHGGKEHFRYPSPNLRKICRRFVEKGTDLIICQHSHCIGCEEKYMGSVIVYGQGNFLFDDSEDECWQTGLLVKVNETFTVSYIPIVRFENGVRAANALRRKEILEAYQKRSEEIQRPGFLEENYARFAASFLPHYLKALSGKHSVLFRGLNRLTGGRIWKVYLKSAYRDINMIQIANYIDCEAHRELLSKALEKAYKGKTK